MRRDALGNASYGQGHSHEDHVHPQLPGRFLLFRCLGLQEIEGIGSESTRLSHLHFYFTQNEAKKSLAEETLFQPCLGMELAQLGIVLDYWCRTGSEARVKEYIHMSYGQHLCKPQGHRSYMPSVVGRIIQS